MVGIVCYAPLIGGLLLLALQSVIPEQRPIASYAPTLLSVGTLFGLIGAGFWVYGWARSARGSPIRFGRGLVAASLLGWIPPALVMTGLFTWSGLEGLLNLTLSFEAAALAWFFAKVPEGTRRATVS